MNCKSDDDTAKMLMGGVMYIIFILVCIVSFGAILMGCATKPTTPTSVYLPGWQVECHHSSSVEGADYCLHTKGSPKKTIWYFPGLGCDQDILQGTGCLMGKSAPSEQKFMAAQSDVTVVTIGFGKATLYDPFDPKETNPTDINATVKNVVTKLIPEITSSMTPKPWQAISHSAGGFNLSQIIMSYPDLFSKALLMHPMMPDCDPYAFVVGLKCDGGLFFIGSEFLESRWIRVTPTTRVKSFSRLPPTMVLVCDQDDFGLVKGPQLFAALGKTGISTYTNCNHYEWRADLAAEFLK